MSNVHNTSKQSGAYHLKSDLQTIQQILHSNQNIVSKCANMWPHIDNLCVYEAFVNPESDETKKNTPDKINYLNNKMKEYKINDGSKNLNWSNLTYEQALIIYGLFVEIFFGVM